MSNDCLKSLTVGTGLAERRIAVRQRPATVSALKASAAPGAALSRTPGLFWLGGFKSDMQGTKAQALDGWARQHGRAFTRFDYSGHGESGGRFADGTIGRWLEESVAVFDACCGGPQVVIGSSMGGWLALLLMRALARRGPPGAARSAPQVAALVLIAPAVDFTEALMWKAFSGRAGIICCSTA